jgi:hypothetical protein
MAKAPSFMAKCFAEPEQLVGLVPYRPNLTDGPSLGRNVLMIYNREEPSFPRAQVWYERVR